MVTSEEFLKVDMRIGKIIKVEDFPEARVSAYNLIIDFGEEIGVNRSSAQIAILYKKGELEGKQIVSVVNFPSRQIANFMPDAIVLGFVVDSDVVLMGPDEEVPLEYRVA